jgi:hypothetical protein
MLWLRKRSSRALSLSEADGVPEYDWKRGRWEDTGKGKCASNAKEAPMARRGLAEMQGRRQRKGGRRMGSTVPSVC